MMTIRGAILGSSGKDEGRTPKEDPNSLISNSIVQIVDLIGEGPILGLVNGAKDIFLDKTQLKNDEGNYNFRGAKWEFRRGYPDQSPVSFVRTVDAYEYVGVEITKRTSVTRTVYDENNVVDHVRITISLPALLKVVKKTGDVKGTAVELELWIQPYGGSYKKIKDIKIQGKTNAQYQRSYLIKNIKKYGPAPWTLKLVRVTDDHKGSDIQDKTYFDSYQTVLQERFSYPDSALVALQLNAKQFGTSIPERAYKVSGLLCKVPSNYDPVARTYSGIWDGEFKTAWTNCPAWCFYDYLTNTRYGLGIPEKYVRSDLLYQIGKWCDDLVPNGKGGMEPRWSMNVVFQTQEEAYHALTAMAAAFCSVMFWGSSGIFCASDAASGATHLAHTGNVEGGLFHYSSAGIKAKHSVALVSWNDPNDFGNAHVAVYEDPEMIERYGWQPTDVYKVGCSSYSEAMRFGRWMIETEKRESETVSFVGSFEFADAFPGSIIKIADPHVSGVRHGGRVVSATRSSVTLDQEVSIEFGQDYTLTLVKSDGTIVETPVLSSPGKHTTLLVSLDTVPQRNSAWILTWDNLPPRYFRVIANSETADGKFAITAVEHDPQKEAIVFEGLVVEDPIPSILPTGPIEPPDNLDFRVFTYEVGRNWALGLMISWLQSDDPRVLFYDVDYREQDGDWHSFGTTSSTSVERRHMQPGTYDFRIQARGIGRSEWYEESGVTIADPDELPPDVTGLRTRDGGNEVFSGKECELVWDDMTEVSDAYARWKHEHYKIQICDKDTGAVKRTVYRRKPEYVYTQNQNRKDFGTPARQFRVKVWAVDINGIQSLNEAVLDCRKTLVDFSGAAPGLEADYNGIDVKLNPLLAIDDDDLEQMMIYVGESTPPTNLKAVVGAKTRHKFLRFNPSQQVTKYVQVVPVDRYGAGIPSQVASVVLSPQPLMDIVVPPIVGGYVAARVQATEPEDCFSGMIWVDISA